jgi:hypothetical protein
MVKNLLSVSGKLYLIIIILSLNSYASERGAEKQPQGQNPKFDPVMTGEDLTKPIRTISLKGSQELLMNGRKGEMISVRLIPTYCGTPVGYSFISPEGERIEGELKEPAENLLKFPASVNGTFRFILDADNTVNSITLDARPAVIKSPLCLPSGGALLYFHVPKGVRAFEVYLVCPDKEAYAGLDVYGPNGKEIATAETEKAGGEKNSAAKIHVEVHPDQNDKAWSVRMRPSGLRKYQGACLSFSTEVPPYVALSPGALMKESEYPEGKIKSLYEPFVNEIAGKLNSVSGENSATRYWRNLLEDKIRHINRYISSARTFDEAERLRAELLESKALVDALSKGRLGFEKCIVRTVKAISNRRILPDTVMAGDCIGEALLMAAVPGEYESCSFVISAKEPLAKVMLGATGLSAANGGSISPDSIDLRAVKAWYQDTGTGKPGDPNGGYGLSLRSGRKVLVPELLLHDDALVKVDTVEEKNYLKVGKGGDARYVCVSGENPVPGKTMEDFYVADAPILQPLDIPGGKNKQFWLTIHVPDNAKPGIYEGKVKLSCDQGIIGDVPMKVRVLPFKFAPPRHIASIYYYAPDKIYYGGKRLEQYRRELENLHAHSIDDVHMPFNVFEEPEAYVIRKSIIGDKAKMVFYGGWQTKHAKTPEDAKENVTKHLNALKRHGIENCYIYGLDEAEGEELAAQRKIWEAVRDAGGMIYVAGYPTDYPKRKGKKGNFEQMGDIQDMMVCAWEPSVDEARRWHGKGHKIVSYANPQSGIEMPDMYRRNFGLLLWQNEYDGAMTYIYHWGASYAQDWGDKAGERRYFPCVWNDDCRKDKYRQHNMVYPTAEGVVDTLEWEGYREAADDLRYMDTLCALIEENASSDSQGLRHQVEQAKSFLSALKGKNLNDCNLDFDVLRAEMIEHILSIHKIKAGSK